jgi:hypothetical protein
MEEACGIAYADSYLSGATEGPGSLVPRTWIAYERLKFRAAAMGVLKRLGIVLLEPAHKLPQAERTDLTEAEYDSLLLSEKIRHHLMCAMEAYDRAGPMWRRGKPVGPSELPQRWHDNTQRAKHHLAEAERLKKLVTGATASP